MTAADASLAAEVARLRAENAALRQERDAAQRGLSEALEQQTATAEVLQAISRSAFDLGAVLDTLVQNAARLCGADDAVIGRVVGDRGYVAAHCGPIALPIGAEGMPMTRGSATGRAVLERRTVHVPDVVAEAEEYPYSFALHGIDGHRTTLATPLLRDGAAIGVIVIRRKEVRPFTEQQEALLETFADQAVIAIENTRLFSELQESNATLREALEQQTATADVLRIISRAPTQLRPVLEAVLESAARLCVADLGIISRIEGEHAHLVATLPRDPSDVLPRPTQVLARRTVMGTALRERRIVNVFGSEAKILATFPDQPRSGTDRRRARLAVPLMRGEAAIGAFVLGRSDRPFTDAEVTLVQTFADQAVIAIENARLFEELEQRNQDLTEALAYQTATSDVLEVIGRFPVDPQPVFDALVERMARLCAAERTSAWLVDGSALQRVAITNPRVPERGRVRRPISPTWMMGATVVKARTIHVWGTIDAYRAAGLIDGAEWMRGHGLEHYTTLGVPLLREGTVIGMLQASKDDGLPFAEKQVALVETFARQAVIAIENSRLFEEIQAKSRELETVNRQLEEANRHKSAFVASMSHELRTPLNAIIGYSEMLQEEAEDLGAESMVADLGKVNAAGKHLLSLINNVLDLSKIEAGRMDLYLEDFAVADLVRDVVAVVQPLVETNGNRLVVEADDDLGVMRADLTKVRQALFNLLSNAAKFTEGGVITLSVNLTPPTPLPSQGRGEVQSTAVELGTPFPRREGGRGVRFTVADTGIGMTPEQVSRLFQAFSQAEADTAVKYGGTGLGLALSREFCRMMGGDITVASSPGQGSTFTVYLPAGVPARPGTS
jgi:signal transduction histidine kinase